MSDTSSKTDTSQSKTKTKAKASTTTTKVSVGAKALPVVTADEIGRIIDLGLGRGIDATNPSPWQNKSSFQVRRVSIDNVLGTEEGGSLQSYEREVSSVTTQQTNLKASVAVPQAPVNLGLEGEQSRSVTTTRKAIGKRVINRTISFASEFDDLSQSSSKSTHTEEAKAESIVPRVVYPTAEEIKKKEEDYSIFNFEERLSKWILERVIHRCELAKKLDKCTIPPEVALIKGVNPRDDLSSYLNAIDPEEAKKIVGDCADFVRHFRITHYVSSVSLGAAQYRILSETEYYNKVSASGTFGFEAIANFVLSETFSKKTTTKASDLRQIGRIVNETVARGTYDEAVVGIGILPLHQLVQMRFLHLALRKALLDYIDVQGDTSSGPFLITAGDNKIYLRVNERNGYAVEGTTEPIQASLFYIMPTDSGDHPYEFVIGWQGDGQRQIERTLSTFSQGHETYQRMFRFLDARVNILGRNSGPLYMRNDIEESRARFSLHARLFKRNDGPVDLQNWVLGRDQFFINCARRRAKIDGYLALKRINRGGVIGYNTACVSSHKHHNEESTFMLFTLLSPKAKYPTTPAAGIVSPEHKLDDEFDAFVGEKQDPVHLRDLKEVPLPGKHGEGAAIEMTPIVARSES